MPKPMVKVGDRPILWHIMSHYARYGFTDFAVALGYLGEKIKEYFLNYSTLNSNFSINLKSGMIKKEHNNIVDWNVSLVDTGPNTMTGGRIKRMRDLVGNNTFMLTYGDGISDIDLGELLKFHKNHGKMITLSAVRPAARFGELEINEGAVELFKEKPQLADGWINGGFFVIEPTFLDLIEGDHTMLEREPLEKATKLGQLMAFKHEGFWQCMDNKRDHELLNKLWYEGAPWLPKK